MCLCGSEYCVLCKKKKKKMAYIGTKKKGLAYWVFYFVAGEIGGSKRRLVENPSDRRAWQATVHGVTRVRHSLVAKPPPLPYSHQERAEGRELPHEPTAKMVLYPKPVKVYHSQPPAFISPGLERRRELRGKKAGGKRAVKDYFFLDFLKLF